MAPPVDASLDAWPERIGLQALALIAYPWARALPEWTISFLPGRKGLLGGTWTTERRVEVYVRQGQRVHDVAFTLAHEIGHAVDVTFITGADRARWFAARGIDSDQIWWADPGEPDFATGAGDFAESFAAWQVGEQTTRSQSRWGSPSPCQLRLLAELTVPTP